MFFWKSRTQSDSKSKKRKPEARPNLEGLEDRVVLQAGSGGGALFDIARLRSQALAERRLLGPNSPSVRGVQNFTNFTRQLQQFQNRYNSQLRNFEQLMNNNNTRLTQQMANRFGQLARTFDQNALRRGVATSFDTSRLGQQFARQAELANNRLLSQFNGFRGTLDRDLGRLEQLALTAGTPYADSLREFRTVYSTNFDQFGTNLQNTNLALGNRLNTANTDLSTAFNNAVTNFGTGTNPVGQFFASLSGDEGDLGRFQRDFTSNLNTFNESARSGFTNLSSTTGSINDNFYSSLNNFYFTPSPATGGGGTGGIGGGFGGGSNPGTNLPPGTTIGVPTRR